MPKKETKKVEARHVCKNGNGSCFGGFYFLGMLGAAIYYLSNASGFWNGVLGILKAIIWPLFLVYELFGFIGA